MSFVYLASPYTHSEPQVREARFRAAAKAAAKLMKAGQVVFSPIAHSHPIELEFPEKEDGMFWKRQDIPILRHAEKLVVLMLDGWEQSSGIKWEVETALSLHIPVEYINE